MEKDIFNQISLTGKSLYLVMILITVITLVYGGDYGLFWLGLNLVWLGLAWRIGLGARMICAYPVFFAFSVAFSLTGYALGALIHPPTAAVFFLVGLIAVINCLWSQTANSFKRILVVSFVFIFSALLIKEISEIQGVSKAVLTGLGFLNLAFLITIATAPFIAALNYVFTYTLWSERFDKAMRLALGAFFTIPLMALSLYLQFDAMEMEMTQTLLFPSASIILYTLASCVLLRLSVFINIEKFIYKDSQDAYIARLIERMLAEEGWKSDVMIKTNDVDHFGFFGKFYGLLVIQYLPNMIQEETEKTRQWAYFSKINILAKDMSAHQRMGLMSALNAIKESKISLEKALKDFKP